MFVCAILGATIFIPNTELVLLALANMDQVPAFHMLGMTVDLSKYSTTSPWMLPVTAAVGSNIANTIWYLAGAGLLKVRSRAIDKIKSFDVNRLGRAREVLLCTAALFSVPPVTPLAFASGVIRYGLLRYHLVTIVPKIIRYYLVMQLGRAFLIGIINLIV